MRTLKRIDLLSQAALLILVIVSFLLLDPETLNPMTGIIGFAIVQVVSIIIHLLAGPQPWKKIAWRKFHLISTGLILLIIGLILIADSSGSMGGMDSEIGVLFYASIAAVLLSLFYLLITIEEWRRMNKPV